MKPTDSKKRKRDHDEDAIFLGPDPTRIANSRPAVGTTADSIDLVAWGMGTRADPIDLTGLAEALPAPAPPPRPKAPPVTAPPVEKLVAYKTLMKPGKDIPTEYQEPGNRNISLGYDPFWMNQQGQVIDPAARMNRTTLPEERQAWLDSYPNWKQKREGWVGKKILGQGMYGIAGLFGLPDSVPLPEGQTKRNIVVKQAGGKRTSISQLINEKHWLGRCRDRGSKHVVMKLKGFYEGRGQGTIPSLDAADTDIARLYLEFCEGGDLSGYIKKKYKQCQADDPMPEEEIWLIFKCLALGLCMMAYGSEDQAVNAWNHEVVHFDIKPDNILIGSNDDNHRKIPIFKFADFGMADDVPAFQSKEWLKRRRTHGTRNHLGPEQYIDEDVYPSTPLPRRFGTALNVWQIAKLMACVILRGRTFEPFSDLSGMFDAYVGADDALITTMCAQLLDAPYSITLRKTVLRALAYNHAYRQTPRELVVKIDEVLKNLEAVNTYLGIPGGDLPLGQDEPEPYYDSLAKP